MRNKGYILIARSLDHSDVAKMSPSTRELWLYLLRKVNHKSSGQLNRGQGFFNMTEVSLDLAWNVGYRLEKYKPARLTKALRRLRESNMIECTKGTHGILITICNYDHYQNPKNYESNRESNVKAERKPITNHNKNKNVKTDKKERSDSFENFWKLYDKNSERKKCFTLWNSLSADKQQKILVHVSKYVISSPDKRYRKNPAKYLSDECWNDEIISELQKKPNRPEKKAEGLKF